MRENMKLVAADDFAPEEVKDYFREFEEKGISVQGSSGIKNEEFVEQFKKIPNMTLLYVREEDEKIIGMVNIRYGLNAFLFQEGGHIGYSIRPSEWGRGYGTALLQEAVSVCRLMGLDRVLVVCMKDNPASARVIEKCGGVLEDEVTGEFSEKRMRRYWVEGEW